MKTPDDPRRLRHILDFGQKALEFSRNRRREDLDTDEIYCLAIARLLEMIGEAANQISHETCQKYPEIPWHAIVGMRNRIIHGYFEVDLDLVWKAVDEELEPLIDQVQKILDDLGEPTH